MMELIALLAALSIIIASLAKPDYLPTRFAADLFITFIMLGVVLNIEWPERYDALEFESMWARKWIAALVLATIAHGYGRFLWDYARTKAQSKNEDERTP